MAQDRRGAPEGTTRESKAALDGSFFLYPFIPVFYSKREPLEKEISMHSKILHYLAGASLMTLGLTTAGLSQQPRKDPAVRPGQTTQGPPATSPTVPSQESQSEITTGTFSASLVDPEKNSKRKWATVEVKASGFKMTDPAKAKEQPKKGGAHLHYQLDDGPVVATTSTKLSFHDLPSGKHKIKVILAANDHSPLGPEETVDVEIP
jgi:hypothetical protein